MREPRRYYVYIMGSLSGTLYVGFTGNLHKRVFEHKFHKLDGFTSKYDVERLRIGSHSTMFTKRSAVRNN